MSDSQRTMLRGVTLGLIVVSAMALAPFWASLVLAAWLADALQPAVRRLQRLFGGRRRGAAAIVVLFVVAALIPLIGTVATVVASLGDLLAQVRAAREAGVPVGGVLWSNHSAGVTPTFREWADLVSRYGADAWRYFVIVARTSVSVVLAIVVFVAGLYAFAASGTRSYLWLARNSPLPRRAFTRFARAFRETGRGLVIGGAGTALVQGIFATVAYIAIGVPRPMLFGPLTAVAALVPVAGTGLVWVPLAIELAVTGHYAQGIAVAVVGAAVLGLIDNFVRPILMRYGRLNLRPLVLLVAMLGGIAAFGASGALLGPLVVRLTVEALAIAREGKLFAGPHKSM